MESLAITLRPLDDPKAFATDAIQAALNRCRDNGGGEVRLTAGDYPIASLQIFSNTTLYLCAGARLIASDNYDDYADLHVPTTLGYLTSPFLRQAWRLPECYVKSPITAIQAENVAVIGEPGAVIDGSDCYFAGGEEGFRGPMGMVFCQCRGVTLRGYTYQNAANWCHQLDSCRNVTMSNVTILGGHDGVNIHHCVNVRIEDCDFRTGDDCVAGYDAENVTVRRCSLNTSCNTFRIGGRNFTIEDCRCYGPGEYPHRISGRHNTLNAFAYYCFQYDENRFDSENWVIRNCTFENLDNFIYYNFGGDWNHDARPLRSLCLENVRITGLCAAPILKTLPEAPMEVSAKNVTLTWRDGTPRGFHISPNVRMTLENVTVQGINA